MEWPLRDPGRLGAERLDLRLVHRIAVGELTGHAAERGVQASSNRSKVAENLFRLERVH
jgi:hypothetical protein